MVPCPAPEARANAETPTEDEQLYVALFNLADRVSNISTALAALGLPSTVTKCTMTDLWTGNPHREAVPSKVVSEVEAYGVTLLALTECK